MGKKRAGQPGYRRSQDKNGKTIWVPDGSSQGGSPAGGATRLAVDDFSVGGYDDLREQFYESALEGAAEFWDEHDPGELAAACADEYGALFSRSDRDRFITSIQSKWEDVNIPESVADKELSAVRDGLQRVEDIDDAAFSSEVVAREVNDLARAHAEWGLSKYKGRMRPVPSDLNGLGFQDEVLGAITPANLRRTAETTLNDEQWDELSGVMEEAVEERGFSGSRSDDGSFLAGHDAYQGVIRRLSEDPDVIKSNDNHIRGGGDLTAAILDDLSSLYQRRVKEHFAAKYDTWSPFTIK